MKPMNRSNPAPMSQFQNFVQHDKTAYPFKKTPQYPKYHRIILRSVDKIEGTNNNAQFIVDLPDYEFLRTAVLMVEHFYVANQDSSALGTAFYHVHLKELIQPKSYCSDNQCPTDIILTTGGYFHEFFGIQTNTFGIPILDKTLFNNKRITIQIDSPLAGFTFNNDWCLTLAVYEVADDEI